MRWIAVALALWLVAGAAWAEEATKTTVLQRTAVTNIGQPIKYPRRGHAEITTMIVEIPPGGSTMLHRHRVPVVGYILEGTLEVRTTDGKVNRYRTGQSLVEALNRAHQGFNVGTTPCRILVMVIGVKGEPYATPAKR